MLVLLAVVLCAASPPPVGGDAGERRSTALRAALTQAGYESVPLRRGISSGWWYVDVRIGSKPAKLMLDTGASGHGIIAATTVARLGLKTFESSVTIEQIGRPAVKVGVYQTCYIQLSVGSRATPITPICVIDDRQLATLADQDEMPETVGLLGTAWLASQSAVIDYPSATLYLLDPSKAEPGLAGEWEAVGMTSKGRRERFQSGERRLSLAADGLLRHDARDDVRVGGYTLDTSVTPRAMEWHIPYTDPGRIGSGASDRFLYRLTGDELVVCGKLYHRRSSDGFPLVKIDGSASSPYDVVTFRRVRETAPPPRPAP